jgi:hypothetical protein
VKVAYDTIILPLFRGGIKILDLEAQPSTLLACWGNYASLEPWKILFKHRLDDLKQHYKGFWALDIEWMMMAPKVKAPKRKAKDSLLW